MTSIAAIPEIDALDQRRSLIRIPGEQDVPVTARVRRLIDSEPFRRLAGIRQLGLVSLVYPGATHSRLEHSLGVYRNALLFLRRLGTVPEFAELVSPRDAEAMIVAALLHDIGHWPYCHPLEDLCLERVPRHEALAAEHMARSEIAEILAEDFELGVPDVSNLLTSRGPDASQQLRYSLLSGPIDVDKMDYLYRDSLHAGVPYGMHYDRQRLIGALCVDPENRRLAITEKGCTAAELMVFARYVMFSEVYWHHTVRSATAMLQRALFHLQDSVNWDLVYSSDDAIFENHLLEISRNTAAEPLASGLFGPRRTLYKRVAQFTIQQNPQMFSRLSRRPWPWLTETSARLAGELQSLCGVSVSPLDVLIDAPPQGLEIQFQIPVRFENPRRFVWLGDVSPVVETLANRQFDDYVKRVRLFVHPRLADPIRQVTDLEGCLSRVVDAHGNE